MTEIAKSNQWKYKISIKEMFEEETTPELTATLCQCLVGQLNTILTRVCRIKSDEGEYFYSELEITIDNFEFLGKLASGTIKKEEWDNYSFDGDFEKEFNGYMSMLYDLADQRIVIGGVSYKFLWID